MSCTDQSEVLWSHVCSEAVHTSSLLPTSTHCKASNPLAYNPKMSKKNRKNAAKSSEEGTVGGSTWSLDNDEGTIWCRSRFPLRRLPLPLGKRPSRPGGRTCSSEYFDLVLIKRCVEPAFAIVFACSNHLVDLDQTKHPKDPTKVVILDGTENDEVWELSIHLRVGSEDLMTHISTSPSLPAFRTSRKLYPDIPLSRLVPMHQWNKTRRALLLTWRYVHMHSIQRRRLSLSSDTF